MKSLALVLLCAACAGDDSGFPVEPGTGGSASTKGSDEVDTPTTALRGRVCVRESLFMRTCLSVGADNLTVTLGGRTTTTTGDGTFVLPDAPVGTGLSFNVSGPGIVTTSQALNARAQINALRQQAFDSMLTVNGLSPVPGTGSVIASLTDINGVPVSGVSATSTPVSAAGPFFDGTEPMPWSTNSTGVSGIVWFPGLVAGPAELSFNTLTGGEAIVGGVQVINGGITMVETPLP
jgi:hypothetical protein